MSKLLEVVVNERSHTVIEENGLEILDYPLWRDRLFELEAEGWSISKAERNEERNRVIYHLEKSEEVRWEYTKIQVEVSTEIADLNKMGKEGWELVFTVPDMLDGTNEGFNEHILKRRVVS